MSSERHAPRRGLMLIISSPSGAGKTSLSRRLVADHAELEAWERRLTELGVAHSPVDDQPLYSVVVFRDPDNVQLEFICMA